MSSNEQILSWYYILALSFYKFKKREEVLFYVISKFYNINSKIPLIENYDKLKA
jgi:hypothetical protein